ncbi:MAG: type III-A CRISPR-associated protein Csm2 [Euryarchaeota archaeon]
MSSELKLAELKERYLYKPGRLDRDRREEVERRFEELVSEFKRQKIRLRPDEGRLMELAFYAAALALDVAHSQLRKIYAEVTAVRDAAREAAEGRGDWDEVIARLGRARVTLAYAAGRADSRAFERLHEVLDEALRRATGIVEGDAEDEVKRRAVEALHFLMESIIAFHRFLGAR